ncbi:MAG: hypothetical protein R3A80_08035 [Bdellovibrionota bacterium]
MRKILLTLAIFSSLSAFAERRESLKSLEFSFGATLPVSRAYDKKDAHYSFGLGYVWDVDAAFIEARVDHLNRFSGSPTQHYTAFTAGGNFIFLDDELWAAFAGANVGLGFAKVQGTDLKGGFHIGGDIGALFLRQADVNLDLRLRLIYNTADIASSSPFFLGFIAGIHF